MNGDEIYCLLIAIYLHDIGMLEFEEIFVNYQDKFNYFELIQTCQKDQSGQTESKKMFRRKYHHICSEQIILKKWKEFEIIDDAFARAISKIARGHRRSNYQDNIIFPTTMGVEKPINIRFLSILLSIADELDVTKKRTPLIIWNYRRPTNPISLEEWEKHLRIRGVFNNPTNRAQLYINSYPIDGIDKVLNYKIISSLLYYQNKVRDTLGDMPNYLSPELSVFRKEIPQNLFVFFNDKKISEIEREFAENNINE